MTSPLTQLLHDTKPEHRSLIERRDYAAAKQLRETCFTEAASVKQKLKEEVLQRHATERRRLERARQLALKDVAIQVAAEMQTIEQKWTSKEHAHSLRQSQRLELFQREVVAREDAKPVVLSAYVRDLQRSEKRLADFHVYDEATMVLNKIKDREVVERKQADEAKKHRVERAFEIRRTQVEEEEASRRAMAKNAIHLAKFRASQEEERVAKQYEHVQRDMEHAHSLELRMDPLLKAYDRPSFIKAPKPASDGSPKTETGTRGSEYLRRMQGSKYAIPSLCQLYADCPPASPTLHNAETALLSSGLPVPAYAVNGGQPSPSGRGSSRLPPLGGGSSSAPSTAPSSPAKSSGGGFSRVA